MTFVNQSQCLKCYLRDIFLWGKMSVEGMNYRGEESRPETLGFRRRPRSRVRDRTMLTPEAAGIKKSARGSVALPLADLACREHRQPERRPKPYNCINLLPHPNSQVEA